MDEIEIKWVAVDIPVSHIVDIPTKSNRAVKK